jgi:hypothetical protein
VVKAAVTVASHRLCLGRKVLSVVSPSSVWLEGGAFGASSMDTRSAYAVGPTDAFAVAVLVTERVSVVHSFLLLVLALRTLGLVLLTFVLLASRFTLCTLSLVVPWRPGVGLRLCATRRCVQLRRQDSLLGDARISMSTPVWTLSFSPMLH